MEVNHQRLTPFLLETAARLYSEAAQSNYPTDRFLGNVFHRYRKRFGSNDRKVISEAVYGIFRHKLLIEHWLGAGALRGTMDLALAALACEGLLDHEIFRSLWAGKDSVIVYDALRNGEVRSSPESVSAEDFLSIRYSFPLWLVKRWLVRFGREKGEELLRAMNERPPLTLRANPVRTTREDLVDRLRQRGHDAEPTSVSCWGLRVRERFNVFEIPEFKQGFFEVQDEGSQQVVLLLDPKPGEVIWDACAGGGGKTLFLAALMQNKGRVIATDIRNRKLADLMKRARRAGLFNIFPADLTRLKESSLIRRGVDKLIVDAPCSGTGTLRRNPDAKWKISEDKLAVFQRDQLAILESYQTYLKRGGWLIYATCSVEPEENEEVIRLFLDRHPAFKRLEADIQLLPHESGTVERAAARRLDTRPRAGGSGTDGFFIARLIKEGDS